MGNIWKHQRNSKKASLLKQSHAVHAVPVMMLHLISHLSYDNSDIWIKSPCCHFALLQIYGCLLPVDPLLMETQKLIIKNGDNTFSDFD